MDKTEAADILSKRLGKNVEIKDFALAGSGFHSDGYKATTSDGRSYFIKKIKTNEMGFEFPERKIMSLLVSHSMAERAKAQPSSLGVVIKNEKIELAPEIKENTELYHIQDYAGEGRSYLSMLKEKFVKKETDKDDFDEIDKVVDFIVNVHKIKHTSNDVKRLNAIYNDYLRNVIGHPEYLLQLLHSIPDDNPILSKKEQGKFIALMLENMHYFKDRGDRLVALHGDFWGSNLFFRKDGSIFAIDYSRMPWGDAGFDIGLWMSGYLVGYHMGNKDYFKKLGNYFLDKYIEKTQDKEVKKTLIYSLGFISAIYTSPVWVPWMRDEVRKPFCEHIWGMLKKKEFYWE